MTVCVFLSDQATHCKSAVARGSRISPASAVLLGVGMLTGSAAAKQRETGLE